MIAGVVPRQVATLSFATLPLIPEWFAGKVRPSRVHHIAHSLV